MCWGQGQPEVVPGITNAIAVAVGASHTCVVLNTGSIQCWGENSDGQLGDRTTTSSSVPVPVSGITNAIAITSGLEHTCAALRGGSIQCWGNNNNRRGQSGNGRWGTSSLVPVTVSGITNAIAVGTGAVHSCVLLSGGTVQCWGNNLDGKLGSVTAEENSAGPVSAGRVSVSRVSNAVALAVGYSHSCVVLSDGIVQCWGNNDHGRLGDASSGNHRLVPVTVTGF